LDAAADKSSVERSSDNARYSVDKENDSLIDSFIASEESRDLKPRKKMRKKVLQKPPNLGMQVNKLQAITFKQGKMLVEAEERRKFVTRLQKLTRTVPHYQARLRDQHVPFVVNDQGCSPLIRETYFPNNPCWKISNLNVTPKETLRLEPEQSGEPQ
jgi:hypothetical protein